MQPKAEFAKFKRPLLSKFVKAVLSDWSPSSKVKTEANSKYWRKNSTVSKSYDMSFKIVRQIVTVLGGLGLCN